jgi:hypothetical protein
VLSASDDDEPGDPTQELTRVQDDDASPSEGDEGTGDD